MSLIWAYTTRCQFRFSQGSEREVKHARWDANGIYRALFRTSAGEGAPSKRGATPGGPECERGGGWVDVVWGLMFGFVVVEVSEMGVGLG